MFDHGGPEIPITRIENVYAWHSSSPKVAIAQVHACCVEVINSEAHD